MTAISVEDGNEREARIERMLAETRKFVAEHDKLAAEARKLSRDHQLAPWTLVASTAAATTALLGAGAAFFKLVHG